MEDFLFSFNKTNQNRTKHNNKKRLTKDQVAILENCFASNKKLEPGKKFQLANQLGVPPRQVAIWYQNKRARWKTQSLEMDYSALQTKLESVMSEKKKLEEDLELLKEELNKAQEMLIRVKGGENNNNNNNINNNCCEISTCIEEAGVVHGDESIEFWQSGKVMQVDEEELYAYFMGANRSYLH